MDIASIGFGLALGYSIGIATTGRALFVEHWDNFVGVCGGSLFDAASNLIILSVCWPWVTSMSIEAADFASLADDTTDQAGA